MKILILADDLSGAADCALGFKRAGQRADVLLHDSMGWSEEETNIIAVDTDTRPMAPACAAEKTLSVYRALHRPGQRLYKKIDSTLRGNWAAEVAALQPAAGLAIVAPSFPALGRVVRGANVYVNGQALEETPTWLLECKGRDPSIASQLEAAGLKTSILSEDSLLKDPQAIDSLITSLASKGVQALVVDAETDATLRTVARATLNHQVKLFWVGSAGLAREMAVVLPPANEQEDAESAAFGPVLTVVGSVSAVSNRQSDFLLAHAMVREVRVSPDILYKRMAHPDWTNVSESIDHAITAGTDILLRIDQGPVSDMTQAAQLASSLAELIAPHFARVGALMATGGETARAILTRAGVTRLRLIEEIEPGVPLCRVFAGGSNHKPYIVTKAGAFGANETLIHGWQHLRGLREIS
jgi:D-threonate/D-erythronate kinase